MKEDITIIIPTLNEANNINWVINLILKQLPEAKIIVSDDGSKDSTQQMVQAHSNRNSNVQLLDRTKKTHGLTASVIDGILNTKTQYFAVIDGDGQHPPEKIKDILTILKNDNDIVIGTRAEVANDWPILRKSMSLSATALAKIRLYLTGTICRDPMSGFFGGNTASIQQIIKQKNKSFVPEGYKVLFDLLKTKKFKIKEIDYTFGIRKRGTSKIGKKHVIAFLKSIIT